MRPLSDHEDEELDLDELLDAMPHKMRYQILRRMENGGAVDPEEFDEPDESWRDVLPTDLPPPPPVTYFIDPESFADEARRAFSHIDLSESPDDTDDLDE